MINMRRTGSKRRTRYFSTCQHFLQNGERVLTKADGQYVTSLLNYRKKRNTSKKERS
jgi:hypothetical protein